MAKNGFIEAFLAILLAVLKAIIPMISNELKVNLDAWIKAGVDKAKKTENIWDDILMKFLSDLFSVDDE